MAVELKRFEQYGTWNGTLSNHKAWKFQQKNYPFCFSTLVVVLSTQSSKMASCTSCLIWPHGWSHEPLTIRASSKNLSFGNSRTIKKPFWSMLHLWSCLFRSQNQSSSRHVSGWNHLPKCQACSLEKSSLGRPLCPHGPRQVKWISSWRRGMTRGWWGLGYNFGRWRTLLVSICWEARVVERSIFGRQYWIKSERKRL